MPNIFLFSNLFLLVKLNTHLVKQNQVTFALETHLASVASSRGFTAILTMDVTSPTATVASDLGYVTLESIDVNVLADANVDTVGTREEVGFPAVFPKTTINVDIKWL